MKATKLLTIAALLLCSMAASAIPVKPGQWATLTLADGTTVRAELRGNEHGTWFQDAEGQCYTKQGDAYVATEWETIAARRQAAYAAKHPASRRAYGTSTVSGLGYKGRSSQGCQYSIGEWEIPVLMVEFSDMTFSEQTTQELVQNYLTQEGFQYDSPSAKKKVGVGSIRDYFVAQSQGMFKPNFKLLGKVKVDKSYKYYGQNDPQDNNNSDVHAQELAGDAMRAALKQIPGVDFKKYNIKAKDNLHQDGIPLLCMLYAGEAESNHGNPEKPDFQPDLIWPHQLEMPNEVRTIKDVDVTLNAYFLGNELSDLKELAGISVFVHELGHALGLPDWYCTDGKYSADDAFGAWSVMDVGCYNGGLWRPIGYTAYERSYMGWLDIPTYTASQHVKLGKPYDENDCAVFYINGNVDDTEYFIVESRYPSTWYPEKTVGNAMEYGTGLMLSRFSFNQDLWTKDSPNNVQAEKHGQIITADGAKLNRSAKETNLFGNGVNTISGMKFLSGAAWNATLSNITKNNDGTVEFDLALGSATGISNVATADDSRQATCYDLQGRPVSQPRRGLYICNGRKVVIR